MVDYVRGSQTDKWHWCKNCTQYPFFVYQKTAQRPLLENELCEQCRTKEENGSCQSQELDEANESRLVREIPVFNYDTYSYS